jgi:hypothetical protein
MQCERAVNDTTIGGGADDSDKGQLAMTAVTVGNGSCQGRQWQAMAAAATATAATGDSSCDGGQRQLRRRVTAYSSAAGDGHFDGRRLPLQHGEGTYDVVI